MAEKLTAKNDDFISEVCGLIDDVFPEAEDVSAVGKVSAKKRENKGAKAAAPEKNKNDTGFDTKEGENIASNEDVKKTGKEIDEVKDEMGEVRRCVESVFSKVKINPEYEKRQEIVETPIDIKLRVKDKEPSGKASERKNEIKRDRDGEKRADVTSKCDSRSKNGPKKGEEIQVPVDVKSGLEDKEVNLSDASTGAKKSYRWFYVGSIIAIVTAVAVILFIFLPAGELTRNQISETLGVHKISRPAEKADAKNPAIGSAVKISAGKLNPNRPLGALATRKISRPAEKAKPRHPAVKPVTVIPDDGLNRNDNTEKPTAENINRLPETTSVQQTAVKSVSQSQIAKKADSTDEIKQFLVKWKTAWENSAGKSGDFETYMSFYSDDFVSQGMNKNDWRSDKAQKNSRKEWIRVELKNINITKTETTDRVYVGFQQQYKSSNYSSDSSKTLILKKDTNGWKITGIKQG